MHFTDIFRAKHLNTNLDAVSLPEEAKIEHVMTLAWIVDRGGAHMSFSCLSILELVEFYAGEKLTGWSSINVRVCIAKPMMEDIGT